MFELVDKVEGVAVVGPLVSENKHYISDFKSGGFYGAQIGFSGNKLTLNELIMHKYLGPD